MQRNILTPVRVLRFSGATPSGWSGKPRSVNLYSQSSHLPNARSIPPTKATFWSMATIFSWWAHSNTTEETWSGCRITWGTETMRGKDSFIVQLKPCTWWKCRNQPDLDVGVHIHESPFAVLAVDAQRQLHLFVEQDAHFDALFLRETVQSSSAPFEDSQQDRRGSLFKTNSGKATKERAKGGLRLCVWVSHLSASSCQWPASWGTLRG